jgi:ribonuclease BN (tRNA processing enzyme)
MEIRVLGACGSELPGCNLTGFLINDRVLLDAGTVSSVLTAKEQSLITDIILSHAHMDHTRGIPFLIDNILSNGKPPVNIAAAAPVIEILRENILNGKVWPDFSKIPSAKDPGIKYRKLALNREAQVGGLTVRPIAVCHAIPTTGFIITDGESALIYSGDTKETDALWEAAAKLGKEIKAVFIECSYPDAMAATAEKTRHLTPKKMLGEIEKLGGYEGPVYAYHIKSQFKKEVERDIKSLKRKNFKVAKDGMVIKL